jgi:hypothetical protein
MNSTTFRSFVACAVLGLVTLAPSALQPVFAGSSPTGTYDILSFPGATAANCGIWHLGSSLGVTQPGPSNYTETVTDSGGNVVHVLSGTGNINGIFFSWGNGAFNSQPKSNPIHIMLILDGVSVASTSADDPCLPSSGIVSLGPQIPVGFVLRTINCTTAVFDAAGGNPIATGEKILQGQTWFVSTTAIKDAKGKSWVEIFNGGYVDGFIWASCVGGKPASYVGL